MKKEEKKGRREEKKRRREEGSESFGQVRRKQKETQEEGRNTSLICYLEYHVRPNDRTNHIPRSPVQEKKKKKKKKKKSRRRAKSDKIREKRKCKKI